MAARYVAAIDQGTTSTRCILFDHGGRVVASDQREHRQIFPRAGWVEHDAGEIWENSRAVTAAALARAQARPADLAAVGITNQRETVVVWDRHTGIPIHHAIVWQDTRTDALCRSLGERGGGADRYRSRTGLPLATYFSGPKIAWILSTVPGALDRARAGDLLAGTMDSWLVWNMTGGPAGGLHVTDVTNASRTLLMDLTTLDWDAEIASDMGIPLAMLPEIRSSATVLGYGREAGSLAGVPISGVLGDQQAAMFGQACLMPGEGKNTYGTGNFMLVNTGTTPVHSANGLLTTVCYRIGDEPARYALEGSIAVTGSLVQWFRDNLGLISSAAEIEPLARSVADNGGAYIVPAFSGLFAPYWRSDARGVIVGLTRFVTKAHLARAVLEATAFQTREVLDAMTADIGSATPPFSPASPGAADRTPAMTTPQDDVTLSADSTLPAGSMLRELKVDGGMIGNETLMQFQADILGIPVVRPVVAETTALGAAYAAGLAVGFWSSTEEIRDNWAEGGRWIPRIDVGERERLFRQWRKAVTRTFDWVDDDG